MNRPGIVVACLHLALVGCFGSPTARGVPPKPEVFVLGLITTRELAIPHRTVKDQVKGVACGPGPGEVADLGTVVELALDGAPGASVILNAEVGVFERLNLDAVCVRVTGEAAAFE